MSKAVRSNSAHMKLFEEMHTHQFEKAVEDDHTHNFVRMASCYCKVKLFHHGKQLTESITGAKVRKHMSKLILFKHQ